MKKIICCLFICAWLVSCTEQVINEPQVVIEDPVERPWSGDVITYGYFHSLTKQTVIKPGNKKDSTYWETNSDNSYYSNIPGVIKIGKVTDVSDLNRTTTHFTPQNGFILFDINKFYGGNVTTIRRALLKIKLYQRSEFTDSDRFTVSILDTTLLAKSVKEKIEIIQSSSGESASYLNEITLDLIGRFASGNKIVIGVKADNPDQLYAAVQYAKIEFDGDITRNNGAAASILRTGRNN